MTFWMFPSQFSIYEKIEKLSWDIICDELHWLSNGQISQNNMKIKLRKICNRWNKIYKYNLATRRMHFAS